MARVDQHVDVAHGPCAELAVGEERERCSLEEHGLDASGVEGAEDRGDAVDDHLVAEPCLAVDATEAGEVVGFHSGALEIPTDQGKQAK